jgi:hypothetical protein
VPIDLYNRGKFTDFEFSAEISSMLDRMVIDPEGNYRVPMDISKMVNIPERFGPIF